MWPWADYLFPVPSSVQGVMRLSRGRDDLIEVKHPGHWLAYTQVNAKCGHIFWAPIISQGMCELLCLRIATNQTSILVLILWNKMKSLLLLFNLEMANMKILTLNFVSLTWVSGFPTHFTISTNISAYSARLETWWGPETWSLCSQLCKVELVSSSVIRGNTRIKQLFNENTAMCSAGLQVFIKCNVLSYDKWKYSLLMWLH